MFVNTSSASKLRKICQTHAFFFFSLDVTIRMPLS